MSWLEDRARQANEVKQRKQDIAAGAPALFDALWDGVVSIVKEAQAKSIFRFAPLTNGSGYDRVVRFPVAPLPQQTIGAPRELHIRLDKDKASITALAPALKIRLDLGVRDDGTVCLQNAGEWVSIQEAATLMLDQFFFPELSGQAG